MRLRAILCRGMQMSSIKIWRSANIITATVVNFSVQIAGYRIIFQTVNNRFTSICGETSWLAFINCTRTLWTITRLYYNYCRFNVSYPWHFDVADRSGKTNDNLMRIARLPSRFFKRLHVCRQSQRKTTVRPNLYFFYSSAAPIGICGISYLNVRKLKEFEKD